MFPHPTLGGGDLTNYCLFMGVGMGGGYYLRRHWYYLRVTDKAVLPFLSVAGKEKWRNRGKVKILVLVDDHSTMDSLTPHEGEGQAPPLLALKDVLFKVSGGEN